MIIGKITMQIEVAVIFPLPDTTREEAEAELLSGETKAEIAADALAQLKADAEANGAEVKLLSTELSVGEV